MTIVHLLAIIYIYNMYDIQSVMIAATSAVCLLRVINATLSKNDISLRDVGSGIGVLVDHVHSIHPIGLGMHAFR